MEVRSNSFHDLSTILTDSVIGLLSEESPLIDMIKLTDWFWTVIKLTTIIRLTLTYILGEPQDYLEDGPDVIAVVSDYPEVVQDCPRHHLSEIINR